MKNIALIGFMGSGKSTVAALLTKELKATLLETDIEVIRLSGLSSVNEIFDKRGEEYFRELEKKVIAGIVKKDNVIISCGGGVIDSAENMKILKENAQVIFLKAGFNKIQSRLKNTDTRPLFRNLGKAKKLYEQRLPLYMAYADKVIATDNRTPEDTAQIITSASNLTHAIAIKKVCMVIGDPVAHSFSPAMHNAAYRALRIDSNYVFLAERVTAQQLEDKLSDLREIPVHALAVTIPHKETILPYLDKLDATAKEIGAVNTVLNIDGKLIGYNTDCHGAMEVLKQRTALAGKKVAVLGSGGSARAIIYGLKKENCTITIYSRNTEKAKNLAKIFDCKALAWDKRNSIPASNIIINTTPVGKEGGALPIDEKTIREKQIVFDVNYNTRMTPLLIAAKRRKAVTIKGVEMLLRQGMLQFELYTGMKAPEIAMRKAL